MLQLQFCCSCWSLLNYEKRKEKLFIEHYWSRRLESAWEEVTLIRVTARIMSFCACPWKCLYFFWGLGSFFWGWPCVHWSWKTTPEVPAEWWRTNWCSWCCWSWHSGNNHAADIGDIYCVQCTQHTFRHASSTSKWKLCKGSCCCCFFNLCCWPTEFPNCLSVWLAKQTAKQAQSYLESGHSIRRYQCCVVFSSCSHWQTLAHSTFCVVCPFLTTTCLSPWLPFTVTCCRLWSEWQSGSSNLSSSSQMSCRMFAPPLPSTSGSSSVFTWLYYHYYYYCTLKTQILFCAMLKKLLRSGRPMTLVGWHLHLLKKTENRFNRLVGERVCMGHWHKQALTVLNLHLLSRWWW